MALVTDVASYFISLSRESTPYAITPLKLQKLVYYAQGFHLRRTGDRLFEANLLAWEHGPVVRRIFDDYRSYKYNTIPSRKFDNEIDPVTGEPLLTEIEINTINAVWNALGDLDGKTLEELTHQEDPWLYTDINDEIDIELIREYFENQYQL